MARLLLRRVRIALWWEWCTEHRGGVAKLDPAIEPLFKGRLKHRAPRSERYFFETFGCGIIPAQVRLLRGS